MSKRRSLLTKNELGFLELTWKGLQKMVTDLRSDLRTQSEEGERFKNWNKKVKVSRTGINVVGR